MIQVKGLQKSFGEKLVLNGLTFAIPAGEIFGLLGPNGAGKTTTINIICKLLEADAGAVWIQGRQASETIKYIIGIAPQEISVYKDLTCLENLQFFAQIYGLQKSRQRERIHEIIRTFQLSEYANTPAANLSGGWQRRLNIAVALVHSPSVLILDEPTSGLDVEARYDLWNLIENLRNTGVTLLLTTHYLEEAERLCSRIGILHKGQIIAEGTLDELREYVPAKELAIVDTADEKAVTQKAATLGMGYRHYGGKLTLLLPRKFTLKEMVNKFDEIPLTSISLRPIKLEHVYFEVTHQNQSALPDRDEKN